MATALKGSFIPIVNRPDRPETVFRIGVRGSPPRAGGGVRGRGSGTDLFTFRSKTGPTGGVEGVSRNVSSENTHTLAHTDCQNAGHVSKRWTGYARQGLAARYCKRLKRQCCPNRIAIRKQAHESANVFSRTCVQRYPRHQTEIDYG